MFSRWSKCHHSCWQDGGTILRWWWWLSQENFFHVQASTLFTFCLALRKLGENSQIMQILRHSGMAWVMDSHSWRYIHAYENDGVGHTCTFHYLKSLCPQPLLLLLPASPTSELIWMQKRAQHIRVPLPHGYSEKSVGRWYLHLVSSVYGGAGACPR